MLRLGRTNLWTPNSSSVNSDEEDVVVVTRICSFGRLLHRNVAACVTFLRIPLTGLFRARSDLERTVGWFLTPMMAAGGASWAAVLKADSVSILAGSE